MRTERAGAERQRLIERAEEVAERTAGVRIPTAGDMSAWTGRDESGDRWGLSPGALHLGGITVPLCSGDFDASNCGFGVPPAFRERYRNDVRTLVALGLQGDQAALESRAGAIRARLDSLRDPIASQNR